jgi:hypothetical protein
MIPCVVKELYIFQLVSGLVGSAGCLYFEEVSRYVPELRYSSNGYVEISQILGHITSPG